MSLTVFITLVGTFGTLLYLLLSDYKNIKDI